MRMCGFVLQVRTYMMAGYGVSKMFDEELAGCLLPALLYAYIYGLLSYV